MQIHSITPIKKGDPFVTGSDDLDNLLQVYWNQLNALADAEMAGLPEPVFDVPPFPISLISRI